MSFKAILDAVNEEAAVRAAHGVSIRLRDLPRASRSQVFESPWFKFDRPDDGQVVATAGKLIDLIEQEAGRDLAALSIAERYEYAHRIASAALAIVSAHPFDEREIGQALSELRAVA